MPTYSRPGAFVEETFPAQRTARDTPGTSVGAFVGVGPRGPVDPTLVSSWADFRRVFGGLSADSPLAFAYYHFLNNGGGSAWVSRVSGAGAVAATRTLLDRAAVTPLATLSVTAASKGAWGNRVYLDVLNTPATNRFTLVIKADGTTSSNIVETFSDLSMDPADSRYVVRMVNSASKYVVVADLNSATSAPSDMPAAQVNTALASGADGAAPSQADYAAALDRFDSVTGPLVLNLVDVSTASVVNEAISYAVERGDIFVVVDPGVDKSPTDVLSDAAALTTTSQAAVYYPRLVISDPLSAVPGTTRTIAPGGAVVGSIIRTDTTRGVFKAPAGLEARLNVLGPQRALSPAELDSLNSAAAPVNAIRSVPGAGTVVMGARTLKQTGPDKYVSTRRSLIYVRNSLIDLTGFSLFEPNDPYLWETLRATCQEFLLRFWQEGGLRGSDPDSAFFVKCDGDINTPADVESGRVNIEVGVALQYPAEFIVIRLGQFEGGSTSTEIA